MKRTLVIGDIHGGLRALQQVLERAKVTSDDTLVFLGDYVDGWSESAEVIAFLMELQWQNRCIFVRGNHDQWCQDWLRTRMKVSDWELHGGRLTIQSYEKYDDDTRWKHFEFFERMVDYHIDDQNRLFIHAGLSSMHGVEKEHHQSNYSWDRTLWEMAYSLRDLELDENAPNYPKRFKHYKEIYIGHTPTTNYNIDTPIFAHKLINVDTGAAFKGKLTLLNADTKEFWQSDSLPSLYPNEKGRNKS